jgi:hypothetical protein
MKQGKLGNTSRSSKVHWGYLMQNDSLHKTEKCIHKSWHDPGMVYNWDKNQCLQLRYKADPPKVSLFLEAREKGFMPLP